MASCIVEHYHQSSNSSTATSPAPNRMKNINVSR